MGEDDLNIRLAAFDWLKEQTMLRGEDVLPRALLEAGFDYRGNRIPLMGPQGIFKPRRMDLPLSITTAPGGPYDDAFGPGETLFYRYRGTDPDHRDNVGLREVMKERLPLVYFYGLVPGIYHAIWPVYILGDDRSLLTFRIDTRSLQPVQEQALAMGDAIADPIERAYTISQVKVRLHQRYFREQVLEAYHCQCSLCRLRHRELLDAAHIRPDSSEQGLPVVTNGLALCKLHHAAFDNYLLTVTPDYRVRIRRDILEEEDGPVLQHALKELDDTPILLPKRKKDWPDPAHLEARTSIFQQRSR